MIRYSITLLLLIPTFIVASSIDKTFSNAVIEGEVKLMHYDIEKETQTQDDAYANALGGYLKYTTDKKNSFYGSVRFDTSNPVGSSHNKIRTSLFNNDDNATALNVNSEAFIAYRTKNRVMKLGNMLLKTPMMNNDTTRVVPWSYQGFAYTGETTDNIKVQLYHISKIRSFTSPTYKKESASGEVGDSGITMLAFHYKELNGVNLQTYYYYAPELYSTFIAQGDYYYPISDNSLLCGSMQYFNSGNGGEYANSESRMGGDDIDLVALRVSLDSEEYKVSLNYSQNFGESGVVKGYGGLAKVYTTSMIANGRGNYKPETWMIKSSYDLPLSTHSEVALRLTDTKVHDSMGDGFRAYYLHFKHYFHNDASIYFRYENLNFTTDKSDAAYFRAILNYRFY